MDTLFDDFHVMSINNRLLNLGPWGGQGGSYKRKDFHVVSIWLHVPTYACAWPHITTHGRILVHCCAFTALCLRTMARTAGPQGCKHPGRNEKQKRVNYAYVFMDERGCTRQHGRAHGRAWPHMDAYGCIATCHCRWRTWLSITFPE